MSLKVRFSFGRGGWGAEVGRIGPLFLNFLHPPLISRKKVGNEKQFKSVNDSLETKFDSSRCYWQERSRSYRKVRSIWLSVRNWLRLPINRGALGPLFQSRYVIDNLADTPDDERRISNAEKSAKKSLGGEWSTFTTFNSDNSASNANPCNTRSFKDVRVNCFYASLLRTARANSQPRHASSARAKY